MKKIGLIVTSLVVGLVCFGDTQGQAAKLVTVATPYRQSRLQHLYHVKKVAKKKTVSLDIVLKPRQTKTLSQLALAVNTTDSQSFKGYLTPQQFRAKFGQSSATTSRLTRYFRACHLQATAANNGLLIRVKGHVATINKAFAVNLKTARYHGKKIQFSKQAPRLPKQVAQPIRAVVGVTNLMIAKSLTTKSPAQVKHLTAKRSPTKFLKQYHASNLATSGQQGAGQTVGIISFGHVPTAAIKHFWRQAGVPTTGRLETKTTGGATVMDNGDDSDDETALDAEQAGTIAPRAKVRVYTAKFSDIGWLDAFTTAFAENRASSLSLSWGLSENILRDLNRDHLLTPLYGDIMNTLLAQGAIQGISTFVASGDTGAYGQNLSESSAMPGIEADFPADSPWVTATGGSTLPIKKTFAPGISVNVTRERTWGGDIFFKGYHQHPLQFIKHPILLEELTAASGGGISSLYGTPKYQQGVAGVNTYNARKYLTAVGPKSGPKLIHGYRSGRNYPDVVANADPITGYDIYSKNSGWELMGGTSAVAPQFAAMAAVMNSDRSQRMGLWNPQLYALAQTDHSPFTRLDAATNNGNLYYVGQPGKVYNQAAGLGTVNFEKLARSYQ